MELNATIDRLQKYEPIDRELKRAIRKHPNFPNDIFKQLAIMQEEAGEVTKAVNDYAFFGAGIKDVRDELIQTAAMCVRMLDVLPV